MHADAQRNFIACIFFIVIIGIVVLARFASRLWFRQTPHGSDWLCLLSAALFYIQSALIISFIKKYGAFSLGPPLPVPAVLELLKITWIEEFIFGGIITSVKLSILWFYYTIFKVDQAYRRVIIVTAAICILWFVVTSFIVAFQCDPIDAFWTKILFSQYCIDTTKFLLGYELTNLFIDVLILCIPIGIVRTLHLPLLKKIAVSAIFLLGGLACVASIVRISAIWRLPNPAADFDFAIAILAGIIQTGLAITVSCLPTLGPIISVIFESFTRPCQDHCGKNRLKLLTRKIVHIPGRPDSSYASIHRQARIHYGASGSFQNNGDEFELNTGSFNSSPENYD